MQMLEPPAQPGGILFTCWPWWKICGSIRLEGNNIQIASLSANAGSGAGRIAIYSLNGLVGTSVPAAFEGTPGQISTEVPTPTPTSISLATAKPYGDGAEGDLEVPLGSVVDLSVTGTNPERSCPQGGDMVSYAVIELTAGYAKLATTPQGECLAVGDEILLIKMGGEGSTAETTGQNEFLRIGGIDGNTLYFQSAKEYYYGSAADSDSGIGTGKHDTRVQVVRVPHYSDLTVNGTLTGKAWDGTSGGVMAFRVSGTLSGSGVIEMDGDGYLGVDGCGESISATDCGSGGGQKGGTRTERMPKGGGGAHTTNGATGTKGGDGLGGVAYATPESDRLYPGSAGGKGGCLSEVDGTTCGGIGGDGGGVIYILANEVAMPNGVIRSLGEGGGTASGSGAGGSIRVVGENISLSQALVAGGIRNVAGGDGHARAIYLGTITSGVFGSALDLDGPTATPGPTPTPTAVPTLNPASAVWHTRVYNYGSAHPNRVTGSSEMDTYTYDQNGNQVTRLVDGVSWTLAYNAENRLANVSDGDNASEGYLYDGDGVRVARVRPGEATYLFMGGLYEVTLALPSGAVTGSRSYYTVEGQMLAMSDGSTTQYLLTDNLGSVVGVVGATGNLLEERRYLPFGGERTLAGSSLTDLSFTGQRALEGTGLLDYHARQYDPALRAFIQADSIIPNPYGVLDYNRYLYVHANPVRFTDPTGNRYCEDIDCSGRVSNPAKDQGCGLNLRDCLGTTEFWNNDGPKYENDRNPERNGIEDLLIFSRYGKYTIELLFWLGDYGQPTYKQIKGLGNAGPLLEGFIGFSLQLLRDLKNQNMLNEDKLIRAGIIGIEDAVTDAISSPIAIAGGLTMAGLASETGPGAIILEISGYVGGSYISTQMLDNVVWAPLNAKTGFFP